MKPNDKADLIKAWETFLVSLDYNEADRQEILEFIGLLSSAVDLSPIGENSRDKIKRFASENWLETNR